MSLNSRMPTVPTLPQGPEIASFATYAEAQKAVDTLADGAFQVQAVTIVGSDLRMVERVTGRLTYPRVALAGALSGAWFGLFVGLIFGMFSTTGVFGTVGLSMLIGAAFGMLFGVMSYAFTGGRRDFTSSSQVVANRYALLCRPELADEARGRLRAAGITSTGAPAQPVTQVVRPPAAAPTYPQPSAPQPTPPQPQVPGQPTAPDPASEPPRYGQRIEDAPPSSGNPQDPQQ